MGFTGDVMDLVLQRSENATVENIIFNRTGFDTLTFEDPAGAIMKMGCVGTIVGGTCAINGRPSVELQFNGVARFSISDTNCIFTRNLLPASDNALDFGGPSNQLKDIYLGGAIIGAGGFTGDLIVDGDIFMDGAASRTLYGGNDTLDDLILRANSVDTYPFILMVGDGAIVLHTATGTSVSFSSGGVNFGSTGTLGSFFNHTATTTNAFEIVSTLLTSGDGLKVVVDSDIVTTGKILNLYSGPAANVSVFSVDKNGKVTFGEITGAETASIVRDLDDLTIDSGAGSVAMNLNVATNPILELIATGVNITGNALPGTTSTYNIGSASAVFVQTHIEQALIYDSTGAENAIISRDSSSFIIAGGTGATQMLFRVTTGNNLVLNTTNLICAVNLLPSGDGTKNFGSDVARWNDGYTDDLYAEGVHIQDGAHAEQADLTRSLTQLIVNTNAATFEIQVDSIKAMTIDAANSIDVFKTDGSSRYLHEYMISAFSTDPGVTGATLTAPNAETLGGYQLNVDTEMLYLNVHVEDDWDTITDLCLEVIFEVNVDNTLGQVTDTVDLKAVFYYKGDGETANKTQTVELATVVGQSPQFKQFKAILVVDHDLVANLVDQLDAFGIIVNLETDTSEVDDIIINLFQFKYMTTKPQLEVA